MAASSPPAPALISRNADPSSAVSFGNNINFKSCSISSGLFEAAAISSSASSTISLSSELRSSLASFKDSSNCMYSSYLLTIGLISENSLFNAV